MTSAEYGRLLARGWKPSGVVVAKGRRRINLVRRRGERSEVRTVEVELQTATDRKEVTPR